MVIPRIDEIGPWSEVKLEILKRYAVEYSKILANQRDPSFWHVYIDAFAGAGVHLSRTSGEMVLGSPLNALEGGESGPGARPMKKDWVISIREQCREQRVPFFFKQWGGVRKVKSGRLLDGRTYDEYPQRVAAEVPDRVSCLRFAEEFRESRRALVQLTAWFTQAFARPSRT